MTSKDTGKTFLIIIISVSLTSIGFIFAFKFSVKNSNDIEIESYFTKSCKDVETKFLEDMRSSIFGKSNDSDKFESNYWEAKTLYLSECNPSVKLSYDKDLLTLIRKGDTIWEKTVRFSVQKS